MLHSRLKTVTIKIHRVIQLFLLFLSPLSRYISLSESPRNAKRSVIYLRKHGFDACRRLWLVSPGSTNGKGRHERMVRPICRQEPRVASPSPLEKDLLLRAKLLQKRRENCPWSQNFATLYTYELRLPCRADEVMGSWVRPTEDRSRWKFPRGSAPIVGNMWSMARVLFASFSSFGARNRQNGTLTVLDISSSSSFLPPPLPTADGILLF